MSKNTLLLAAIAMVVSAPSWSDEADIIQKESEVTTQLDPIEIRANPSDKDYSVPNATAATKTDTPIIETPVSIQVVPRAVLEDKQAMSLPDAVNGHVSGVLGRTGGGTLYDNFIIRGLSGSGFGDAYRNGLYNRQDIYDLSNIEQIEILKGPAAVLYGRIEPGGLVNYITKKPLNTPYYAIQQQFGSYHQQRTSVDATGPIDENKTVLYRVNAAYTDNESFRDYVGNERIFVAPTLTWRPNEQFEANVELEYKHDDFQADYGIPAVGTRPAQIPLDRNLSDGSHCQTIHNVLTAFDWSYKFNEDWKVQHKYQRQNWTFDAEQVLAGQVRVDNRTQNRNILFSTQDVDTETTSLDLNGHFDWLGTKHNVLVGVDSFWAETRAHQLFTAAPTIDIYNPVYDLINWDALVKNSNFYRKERWSGFYVQDQITFFDKLHLLAGGRYDSVKTGAASRPTSMAAARAARIERSDYEFSPRLGMLYELNDWLSVYGNYTRSFSGNNGVSAAGATFDPQKGRQYEVGFKTESLDKRFSSTIAIFDITKSNLLTDDPNSADPNVRILAGEMQSKGLEIDITGQVTDKLNLLATYAYTDAKYTQDYNGLKGNRLENVPLHQGSLWSTYQVNDAFKAGLGVVALGDRDGDNANSFQMPGYARMDAMVSYIHPIGKTKMTLQLNVNNLLDKDYYANSSGGRPSIIPGSPRSVLGSLKLEF